MIVEHLEMRYNKTQVYTYIGDILLAVNPFTPLTIYSDEVGLLFGTTTLKLKNTRESTSIQNRLYFRKYLLHPNQNITSNISTEKFTDHLMCGRCSLTTLCFKNHFILFKKNLLQRLVRICLQFISIHV